jgi:hypothetical protein
MLNHNWEEELPEQCPPLTAVEVENFICYRAVNGNPATPRDFFSQRRLSPNAVFNASECVARACSVFTTIESLKARTLRLPKFKNALVAELCLQPKDGVVEQGANGHCSWWIDVAFSPEKDAKIINV